MRVLVACEFSGIVSQAFRDLGHFAISCDFLENELTGNQFHYQGNVYDILNNSAWDLMIAHPPCTYLAGSGLHWNKRYPERQKLTEDALNFVVDLMNASIPRIAVENPVGCISTRVRKPDQIIHPWQFGHNESKATCLWLKNLPLLTPTNIIESSGPRDNQTPSGQNKLGPSKDRWKQRSRTYEGIAKAMAEQWGNL